MKLSYEVVDDPGQLGLDHGRLHDLVGRARREVDEGTLPSCQLAVARHGRLAAFVSLGQADVSTRYAIFSCTKALVAGAVWLLIGDGKLDADQGVAELVPELGTNGKDHVTVEQLLTHTAGFPSAPLGPPDWADRDARVRQFSRWRLEWEPGTRFEYHPTSAHWVVAEIIERLSGTDYRVFLRERVTRPLGLEGPLLGVPPADQQAIAPLAAVGSPPTPAELEEVLGVADLDLGEVTQDHLLRFSEPETIAVGVPGAGAVGSAADLALYYQALLHNPGRLWDPDVLADGTRRVRTSLPDPLRGISASRSLGLIVAGDDGQSARRGFGSMVSAGAFGHDGAGGQIAWADPASGISFAYLTNGLDANVLREGRRGVGLSNRAATATLAATGGGATTAGAAAGQVPSAASDAPS